MSDAYMHLQLESRLLSAPAEIRRMIYANIIPRDIHVFWSHEGPYLSVCLQPNLGDDENDGYERGTTHNPESDGRWAGRLKSKWGPHWECEEIGWGEYAKGPRRRFHCHVFSLLYSCKKMFFDICAVVTERAAFTFIDPATLQLLIPECHKPDSSTNQPWSFWKYIRLNIRKLNVAFRLPVYFCKALESENKDWETDTHSSIAYCLWVHFWPAVCQLQQLRSLCIWLDHDSPFSWAFVKERLAFRHMTAAFAKRNQLHAQDKDLPRLDILVNLPKLHPGIARPNTHFTPSSPPLPFTIERRIRQRYHCVELAGGKQDIEYIPDFPSWAPWYLGLEETVNDASLQEMKELKRKSIKKAEEQETKFWAQPGPHMDRLISKLNQYGF